MLDDFIGGTRELAEVAIAMKRGKCPVCRGDLEEITSGLIGCTDCDFSD